MNVGQRVSHPEYGLGTVIAVLQGKQLGDGSWPAIFQSSIIKASNGYSRYEGNLNIAVRFDNGGPQGWAYNATNDIEELILIDGN